MLCWKGRCVLGQDRRWRRAVRAGSRSRHQSLSDGEGRGGEAREGEEGEEEREGRRERRRGREGGRGGRMSTLQCYSTSQHREICAELCAQNVTYAQMCVSRAAQNCKYLLTDPPAAPVGSDCGPFCESVGVATTGRSS